MIDLVERLRNMPLSEACGTMDEAADRIEALEALMLEIDDLSICPIARRLARAAFAKEQDE